MRCRFWTERSFTFFRNQKCENFLNHFFAKLPNYENKNLQSEIFLQTNFQKYQKSENFVQFSTNLENLTDLVFTNVYGCFTNKMMSSKSKNLITTQKCTKLFVKFVRVFCVREKSWCFFRFFLDSHLCFSKNTNFIQNVTNFFIYGDFIKKRGGRFTNEHLVYFVALFFKETRRFTN